MCNRYGHRGWGMRHDFYGNNFRSPEDRGTCDRGRFDRGGRTEYRVPVNIIKNDAQYELYVFAPDRAKEDFKISVKGHELKISYALKEEKIDQRNWIRQEFSKAAFERIFTIDETVDTENIQATYTNGILILKMPIVPGSEKPVQDIEVI